MADTAQQKAVLRSSPTARKTRARFPSGTHVVAPISGERGVVVRHVPNGNAQGGSLRVKWDNGVEGLVSPISVRVLQ